MESGIQNQIQILGTIGDVFRIMQLTQHVPRDDEHHIQGVIKKWELRGTII
jgi:hypothetical protein